MGDVQEPQAGVGGALTGGGNPRPGGTIDTGVDHAPLDDRSTGGSESSKALTDSIERQLENTVASPDDIGKTSGGAGKENVDATTGEAGEPVAAGTGGGGDETPDPHGVGTSDSARGETLEPPATEHKGATNRPVGQVEGDLMEPNNSGSGTSDVD